MQKITPEEHAEVIERCLEAYLRAGTMELSLDQLGTETGVTKRMLVHYFGNRQEIERRSVVLFEERLQAQFHPERFTSTNDLNQAIRMLWEQFTLLEFRDSLRLLSNQFRSAPKSDRARQFRGRRSPSACAALQRE